MDTKDLAAATWHRSSLCDNSGGSCVEVAFLGDTVISRDSKDPQHTVQIYDRTEWTAFVEGVKNGEFDR